jgi:hypothetical protein
MVESLALGQVHEDLALHVLAVLEHDGLVRALVPILYSRGFPSLWLGQFHVDLTGSSSHAEK